jgi:hypothetical protein
MNRSESVSPSRHKRRALDPHRRVPKLMHRHNIASSVAACKHQAATLDPPTRDLAFVLPTHAFNTLLPITCRLSRL